jgi:heme/copper-type cytochrome/quinol oxidase subunit 4
MSLDLRFEINFVLCLFFVYVCWQLHGSLLINSECNFQFENYFVIFICFVLLVEVIGSELCFDGLKFDLKIEIRI